MPTVRTFIYGSCVSRDTFEFLAPGRFDLLRYVARQSLASAFSIPNTLPLPRIATGSAFQRRMLEGDWISNLLPTLRSYNDQVDLLLWDIFDERLGIYRLANGNIVTRSGDSIASRLDEEVRKQAQFVPLGSPAHRQRFRQNLDKLSSLLDSSGLSGRTVLVAPSWATTFRDGTSTPSSYGLEAHDVNPIFDEYVHEIENVLGGQVHVVRTNSTLADGTHRWGPAPFHYDEATYRQLADSIQEFAATLPRRAPTRSVHALTERPPPDPWERLVPHALTRPLAPVTTQSSHGSLRIPFSISAPVYRWRVMVRNASYRGNNVYPGGGEIKALTVGRPSRGANGGLSPNFADEPVVFSESQTVDDLGAGWASPWLDIPLEPGRVSLLGIDYETKGQDVHLAMGGGWWSNEGPRFIRPGADTDAARSIRLPFDIRIEYVTGFDTPVDVMIADSIGAGSNAFYPILEAPIAIARRGSVRAVRLHAFGGASFSEWVGPNWGNPNSLKWRELTDYGPAARTYVALGNNDINAGLDLSSLQSRATDLVKLVRARVPSEVVVCTVTPRQAWIGTPKESVRRDFNDWLRGSPGGITAVADTARAVEDPSDSGPRQDYVVKDGIHFNTKGCTALATALRH